MGFILINLFFGFIIIVSLIILWFVWPPDSPWSPWWVVRIRQIREGLRLAKVTQDDVVYDLGSGDGRVPIIAAREFGASGVGIEIDYIRHLTAWLKVKKNKVSDRVILKRGNFFKSNISDATVVFVYLVPRVLEKIKPKLLAELKKGTRILSYKYKIKVEPGIKLVKKNLENEMYLYKIR